MRAKLFGVAAAAAVALMVPATAAQAATIVVDDDRQCSPLALQDLPAAVQLADHGDTIQVCPGTYHGDIRSSKNLRIVGPQAGVDPASRPVAGGPQEAVVRGMHGLLLFGIAVLVDGLTVVGDDTGTGVDVLGSDSAVRNTVVARMDVGIVASYGARAERNRVTGSAGSIAGIVADGHPGARIVGNTVRDHGGYGIVVNFGSSGTQVRDNVALDNAGQPSTVTGASDPADCRDFSKGTGTAGTASTWSNNTGRTSKPSGLCAAPLANCGPLAGALTGGTPVLSPIAPFGRRICS